MFDFTTYEYDEPYEMIEKIIDDHPNHQAATWFYDTHKNKDVVLMCDHRITAHQRKPHYFYYEVRHHDLTDIVPVTIEHFVWANFYGTIISKQPLDFASNDAISMCKASPVDEIEEAIDRYMISDSVSPSLKHCFDHELKQKTKQILIAYILEKEYIFQDTPDDILSFLEPHDIEQMIQWIQSE